MNYTIRSFLTGSVIALTGTGTLWVAGIAADTIHAHQRAERAKRAANLRTTQGGKP